MAPLGVAPNQPFDPKGKFPKIMKTWAALAVAVMLIAVGHFATSPHRLVMTLRGEIPEGTAEGITWSEPIKLEGRSGAVELASRSAGLKNDWLYLDLALVNETTGKVFHVGQELSYYSGPGWSEGSRLKSTTVGPVPPGDYILRAKPIFDRTKSRKLTYLVEVYQGPRRVGIFLLGFILISIVPILAIIGRTSFENRRWNQE